MENTVDESKMLLIGVVLGAAVGIFGNLWVGAVLNMFSKDMTITVAIFVIGFIAWLLAILKILELLKIE